MSEPQKQITIIAGPNGAGKTTFAREYLPFEANCPVFVNADLIAAGISPFGPDAATIRAGRVMLKEIAHYVQNGSSFAFETTLSGRSLVRMIRRWRADGYFVKLIFLSLRTPEEAIKRVAKRVRQGGHDLPESVIRRRFHKGFRNYTNLYRQCVDHWTLLDNTGAVPIFVSEGRNES